jgi:hypothetical protein
MGYHRAEVDYEQGTSVPAEHQQLERCQVREHSVMRYFYVSGLWYGSCFRSLLLLLVCSITKVCLTSGSANAAQTGQHRAEMDLEQGTSVPAEHQQLERCQVGASRI